MFGLSRIIKDIFFYYFCIVEIFIQCSILPRIQGIYTNNVHKSNRKRHSKRHLKNRRFKHMFGLFFCIIKIILNIGVLSTCLGFILHYRHLRYSRFKHMFALFRIINGICKSLMILLMVCY